MRIALFRPFNSIRQFPLSSLKPNYSDELSLIQFRSLHELLAYYSLNSFLLCEFQIDQIFIIHSINSSSTWNKNKLIKYIEKKLMAVMMSNLEKYWRDTLLVEN